MKLNKDIFQRYLTNTCSDQERDLVEQWFTAYAVPDEVDAPQVEAILKKLDQKIKPGDLRRHTTIKWIRFSAVAACLLAVGFIALYKYSMQTELSPATNTLVQAPVGANAIIVLENKQKFDLDSLQIGDRIVCEGYLITKLADGSIHYVLSEANTDTIYNTLITEAGGTGQLTLSDGSKVWLNANSQLTYPIVFAPTKREVTLNGEAYFEVTKKINDKQPAPFYVHTANHTVQVLGTKFNLNSYDQTFTAALLKGKISIAGATAELVYLNPSEVYSNGEVTTDKRIENHIDWVNGYFNFTGLTFATISKKLSNWYNVDIQLSSDISNQIFYGEINRQKSLNQVLDLLAEVGDMKYSIEGRLVKIKSNNKNINRPKKRT